MRSILRMILAAAFGALAVVGLTGRKGVVVIGAGNSGNTFGGGDPSQALGELMARQPDLPQLTAEDVAAIHRALRARALEGDVTAALALLQADAARS